MDQQYTHGERLVDGVIHVIGVTASLLGVTVMIFAAAVSLPPASTASLAVYGLFMVGMFSASAAYHLAPARPWKSLLRRVDHAAIFLKIAGTYTPFAFIDLSHSVGYAELGSIWAIALAGAAGKLLMQASWERTAIALYLGLGWAAFFALQPVVAEASTSTVALLVVGGLLYTVGVIFHVWRGLPYQNAIWHVFVLVATFCLFASINVAMFS